MTDWNGYLTDRELDRLHTAAVDAGLAATDGHVDALVSRMSPAFVAELPGADRAPDARLREQLTELNGVHNLSNGDVPLAQWLDAAIALARDQPQADLFERMLDRVTLAPAPAAPRRVAPGELLGAAPAAALPIPNLTVQPEAMVGGSDETVDVGFLAGGLATSKSVVKLLVHRHEDGEGIFQAGDRPMLVNGTGWFIGPGLVITNHHVINARRGFPPPGEPDASEQDFRLQAESARVLFDYLEKDQPTVSVACEPGALQASDKELDFAIVRVPVSADDRRPLKLRSRTIRKRIQQALGTRVNILQHPNGAPMRLGFRDNFVVSGDDDGLSYLTDTDFGSSGSPVCDDAWSVAALHSSSRSVAESDIVIRGRKVRRENHGIPIPRIMRHLEANHPDLHGEILAGQG